MRAAVRYYARRVVYSIPLLRGLTERFASSNQHDAKYWDEALAGWAVTYMGQTTPVDTRNAIIATLVRHHVIENPAVLDIGCAGGALSLALSPFKRYLGTDISPYAIEQAAQKNTNPNVTFEAVDLRHITIAPDTWDVIVFAEVLYYLGIKEAVDTVANCAAGLRKNGVIIVSMKDDGGKSQEIYKGLIDRLQWLGGTLWQEKPTGPGYTIKANRECPPYLTAALRAR